MVKHNKPYHVVLTNGRGIAPETSLPGTFNVGLTGHQAKTTMMNTLVLVFVVLMVLVAAVPVTVAAQGAIQEEPLKFGAELYGWFAAVGGQTARGTGIDLTVDEVVDNLQMLFMGTFGVSRGPWAFVTDVVYVSLEKSKDIAGVNTTVEMNQTVVTPLIGYRFYNTLAFSLYGVAGLRYAYLNARVDRGILSAKDAGDVWDGIVGVRGRVNLTPNVYIPLYADIGTGESESTWQVLAGLGYDFSNGFGVVAGYRYLQWNLKDNPVLDDLNFGGAYAGIKFVF